MGGARRDELWEALFKLVTHAIVIGASVAGVLAARALADCFDRVTIVERECIPQKPEPRRGVPQGHQIHVLLASGANVIETLFPGFFKELVSLGAVQVDFSTTDASWFQHGVWKQRALRKLIVHCQTRPFLEHHLRVRLARVSNISIREQCSVLGVALSSDKSCVTGVILNGTEADAAEVLNADLVVDASGRNSAMPKWLEQAGYSSPEVTSIGVRIGYATRFYRASPEMALRWKALAVYARAPASTRSGAVFRVEGDRWIVTLMGSLGDYPPLDDAGFLEFARSLDDPAIYQWLRAAVPLTSAVPYRYPSHLRHHYERLTRFPSGVLVMGDAFCSFNPIYGQGMAVCAMESLALKNCIQHQTAKGNPLWQTFFKAAADIVEGPWGIATGADFLHPQVQGPRPFASSLRNWFLDRILTATGCDAHVTTQFYEVLHLLRKPSSLFRPDIVARVLLCSRNIGKEGGGREIFNEI